MKFRTWSFYDYAVLLFIVAVFGMLIFISIVAFLTFDKIEALKITSSIWFGVFFLLGCILIWFYLKFKRGKNRNKKQYPVRPPWLK